MKKTSIVFWIIALLITIASAYYQEVTGPTYPLNGSVLFNGKEISYKFERSNSTNENCPVNIYTNDPEIKGTLVWKRYKTKDEWTKADMKYDNGILSAELPKQLPAAKLAYKVRLSKEQNELYAPLDKDVVIRFKGDVPFIILLFHVIIMFAAMLVSTRTALEIFRKEPDYKKLAFWTLGLLIIGGIIFGMLVQKYAFGEYWSGIPFGFDLTDNKTLIASIGWIIATVAVFKSKKPGYWILGAAILMLIIFLIPHSVFGSELDPTRIN
jgi:hypothetical protein